ncbi:hypothetical protein TL16_g04507 [Triparma laevis f. inornata]|uniref:Kinesin motor domain-containing protein n=1 Tax=Triparma laevis f. inornata TaxID=1714386 RepID=A0A9W7AC89_9STRA|nr:hypothetical protein TL16_g04507 [Triparma laevis f. inornata]
MSTDGEAQNIRVAVRCRPLSKKELGNNEKSIFSIDGGNVCLKNPATGETQKFNFDGIFPDDSKQTEIWDWLGQPLLDKCIEGFNGTVFAYGQTGSGKTFSMQGVADHEELRGLIPRFTMRLFERIVEEKAKDENKLFLITCSYFEIYNEVVSDLLDPTSMKQKKGLDVKEHPVLGVYVKGLQEIVVEGHQKMQQLITVGMGNRHVASTKMNEESSRSHSVFTIKIHQKDKTDDSKSTFAKVNLVDLAGSERAKSTGASGATLKEGANINKSLSALGNVINALVESAKGKKNVFVPYRNSKLTRVLQESLGGNSLTAMLAALSPAAINHDETLSTLKYAARAKSIKLSAKKNEEASQISQLNDEIAALKKKLAEQAAVGGGDSGGDSILAVGGDPEAEARYRKQIEEMESAMADTWEQKEKVSNAKEAERLELLKLEKEAKEKAEEEKEKRWQLLEEKNDVELSMRNATDIAVGVPGAEWMRKVRSMLALEQQAFEETTVATVYRSAFESDSALNQLINGDNEVQSSSVKQLSSKLAHLQDTSDTLWKTQDELTNFATDFVREIRSNLEASQAALETIAPTLTQEGEHVMAEDNMQAKGKQQEEREVREEAARGLGMVVRQLNRKRASITSAIQDERAKIFSIIKVARELLTTIEAEIEKSAGDGEESEGEETVELKLKLGEAKASLETFLQKEDEKKASQKMAEGADTGEADDADVISEADMANAKGLGMSSGRVLNKQISSSNDSDSAVTARLNQRSKHGGWVGTGGGEEGSEWLQIDLKRPAVLIGIIIQGRHLVKKTVKKQVERTIKKTVRRKKEAVVEELAEVVEETSLSEPIALAGINRDGINMEIDQTSSMLGEVIDWPTLLKATPPSKLLGRPPVRFLFDLINLVKSTTGFGGDANWAETGWGSLKSKGDKVIFMDAVIGYACGRAGWAGDPPAKGSDIVTGSEAGNTCKFLQLMGLAASAVKLGVAMEGVMGGVVFVKSLKICTSMNGDDWDEGQVLEELTNEAMEKKLASVVMAARFVRLVPLVYTCSAPAMRVEIHGIFKDEQAGMKSPRGGSAEGAYMDKGFVVSVGEMIVAMRVALNALYLKTEVDEKAEKRRMARSRDNLAGEKEELEARLKSTEEEKAGLAAQVAELNEKLNEFQFGSVKLQAQKEKDDVTIARLTESVRVAEKGAEEKELLLKTVQEQIDGLESNLGDVKGQLEVVEDERNIAREKEEQLFEKLADTDAELVAIQESYVYMTDKSNDYQDEIMELQEQVEGYKEMVEKQVQNAPVVLQSAPVPTYQPEEVKSMLPEGAIRPTSLKEDTLEIARLNEIIAALQKNLSEKDDLIKDLGMSDAVSSPNIPKQLKQVNLKTQPEQTSPAGSELANEPGAGGADFTDTIEIPFHGDLLGDVGDEREEQQGGEEDEDLSLLSREERKKRKKEKKKEKMSKQQLEILEEREKLKKNIAANKGGE